MATEDPTRNTESFARQLIRISREHLAKLDRLESEWAPLDELQRSGIAEGRALMHKRIAEAEAELQRLEGHGTE